MKIGVVSLGCTKNLVDTEVMLGLLKEHGHKITSMPEEAEIIIINTCSFIESAKNESIENILEMAQMKREGFCHFLIVTGCLAQEFGEQLFSEIPEIDALLGTGEFKEIVSVIKTLQESPAENRICAIEKKPFLYDHTYPRVRSTWHHLSYIKISEGCNHRCSYCLIPSLRGGYRERTPESILKEAKALVENGVREICIIGQDTTAFGLEEGTGFKIPDLLQELAKIDGSPWIRLLYTYPASVDRRLLDVMKNNKNILSYLDIPLQHSHPRILRAMNRPADIKRIEGIIDMARALIPDIVIRTTLMVGFPGEGEDEFESILKLMERVRFDHLGAFLYSRERATTAYNMPDQVPKRVKKERYRQVMELQSRISREKNQGAIGSVMEVMADHPVPDQKDSWVGRSMGQAPEIDGVTYIRGKGLIPGEIIMAKIVDSDIYDLEGIKI